MLIFYTAMEGAQLLEQDDVLKYTVSILRLGSSPI